MIGHTTLSRSRTSRSTLRVALAAAVLGVLCACAGGDPTGPTASASQRAHMDGDNSGIMGSGYYTEPDTTHHP